MITTQLLRPESIVVVGASNNVHKPGGAILKNLINGGYQGELRAVNPKEKEVQGVPAFADVNDLPDTDLAVLAVPASMCPDMVETLATKKLPIRARSGDATQVFINDLNLKLQNAGKHSGKTLNCRLNLHQY
jgi:acyl-CoA synthetase (NDP forming)